MNCFCIMRFQKYQKNGCAKIDRHNNDRKHLRGRKHPELEKYNFTRKKYNMTMTQLVNKKVKEIKNRTGKNTAKNKVVVAEFVLTFSPEMTEQILQKKDEWVKANIEWLKNTYEKKGGELVRFDFHMDETTPHLHAFVLTTDEKGLFNGSHFFAKKSMLTKYQDTYAEAMKPFGLKRGISADKTKAKHMTKTAFLENDIKKIDEQIDKLKTDAERIEQKRAELSHLEEILDKRQEETKEIINSVFDDEKPAPKNKDFNNFHEADDVLGY